MDHRHAGHPVPAIGRISRENHLRVQAVAHRGDPSPQRLSTIREDCLALLHLLDEQIRRLAQE